MLLSKHFGMRISVRKCARVKESRNVRVETRQRKEVFNIPTIHEWLPAIGWTYTQTGQCMRMYNCGLIFKINNNYSLTCNILVMKVYKNEMDT